MINLPSGNSEPANPNTPIAFISIHGDPLAPLGGPHHGGQNVYVKELSRGMIAFGYKIDVFTRWESPNQLAIEEISGNARVVRIPVGLPQYIPKEDTVLLLSELGEWITRFREEHQIKYQLIHAHYYFSGAVSLTLHETWGVPFIQTFHSLGAVKRQVLGDQDSSPIRRVEIERQIVQAADRIVATAPQEMDDLTKIYAADPTRITVIPCGVNLDLFHPEPQIEARIFTGVPSDEFLITFVGRLEKRKGVDTMLEAMGILLAEQPNLPLAAIIVGGQPRSTGRQTKISTQEAREHRRYKKILDDYHIADRVTFTGGLPQNLLYHYYSAGDVTIIPSYYEPFGMTALEALACGSSVIVSRVGGLKTTVQESKVGLHFEPRNPHDLAKQIKYLMDHPEINARFRKNARQYVEILYSWRSIAERMSSLYREEISKNQVSME